MYQVLKEQVEVVQQVYVVCIKLGHNPNAYM